jgi:hypothetical protein
MPHWPVKLLLKLASEPSATVSGATATADAFLPSRGESPLILVARLKERAQLRAASRRWARRPPARRRLAS